MFISKKKVIKEMKPDIVASCREGHDAAALVDQFLQLLMVPDPASAGHLTSPELQIVFTGGRTMKDLKECSAFNSARYKWVKKKIDRYEVVPTDRLDTCIVYCLGSLFGAWPDGEVFDSNRFIDRYVVKSGQICEMHVWNDSAECILSRHTVVKPSGGGHGGGRRTFFYSSIGDHQEPLS